MKIVFDKFNGIAPMVSPDLLPPTYAQVAHNLKLENGKPVPYKVSSIEAALPDALRKSIYRHKFNGPSVICGPIGDLSALQSVNNGTFKFKRDITDFTAVAMNFRGKSFAQIADVVQQSMRDATMGAELAVYDTDRLTIATTQASLDYMADGESSNGATNIIPKHTEDKGYSYVEGGQDTGMVSGYDSVIGWLNNPNMSFSFSTAAVAPAPANAITIKNSVSEVVIGWIASANTTGTKTVTTSGVTYPATGTINVDVVLANGANWNVVATKSDTITASSQLNTTTNAAWKCVDGLTTTAWLSAAITSGTPVYWQIEFERKYVISGFKIYNGATYHASSLKDFTLQGSNDGTAWTIIQTYQNLNVTSGSSSTFAVTDANRDAFRYYRINITTRNGGTNYCLADIEFYHTPVNIATYTYLCGKLADGATKSTYQKNTWLSWTSPNIDVIKALTDMDNYNRIYWTGDSDHDGKLVVYGVLPNAPTTREIGNEAPTGIGTVVPTYILPTIATASCTAVDSLGNTLAMQYLGMERTSTGYTYMFRQAAGTSQYNADVTTAAGHFYFTVPNGMHTISYDGKVIGTWRLVSMAGDGTRLCTCIIAADWLTDGDNFVYYMMSYVNDLGEEGPLSPISALYARTSDQVMVFSNIPVPKGGTTLYPKKRIYRSTTGTQSNGFKRLVELDSDVTTYTDRKSDSELGDAMPQRVNPQEGLKGLCMHPGGFAVAFKGREVWFSDVNLIHSWPYFLTTDSDIVGIAVSGNDVYVLTKEFPHMASGNSPGGMSMAKLSQARPCRSKRSIKRMGSTVMYASNDGLVAMQGGVGTVVTEGIYTPEQWQALHPELMIAEVHENKYHIFIDNSGVKTCIIYNGKDITTNDEVAAGTFEDLTEGKMYLIDGGNIMKFEGGNTYKTMTWKSKEFLYPKPNARKCFRITPDGDTINATINMYMNSVLKVSQNVVSSIARRFQFVKKESKHAFEITANHAIDRFEVADSMEEIQK